MEIEFCLDNTLNTVVDDNLYTDELTSSTKEKSCNRCAYYNEIPTFNITDEEVGISSCERNCFRPGIYGSTFSSEVVCNNFE